jgi:hypothetical protein
MWLSLKFLGNLGLLWRSEVIFPSWEIYLFDELSIENLNGIASSTLDHDVVARCWSQSEVGEFLG